MKKRAFLLIIILFFYFVNTQSSFAVLCDGCMYKDKCLEIGIQRLTSEKGYEVYCNENGKIEKAKEDNQECKFPYECRSYYCDGVCKTIKIKKSHAKIIFISTILFISLIASLVAFLFKRKIIIRKKAKKVEQKKEMILPSSSKINLSTKGYMKRYSSLEKELSSSLEKFQKVRKEK